MKRILAILLILWAHAGYAQAPASPLADADTFGSETHVIITAQLSTPEDGIALGEELVARFGGNIDAIWPLAAINVICLIMAVPDATAAAALSETLRAEDNIIEAYPIQSFETLQAQNQDVQGAQHTLTSMQIPQAHQFADGAGIKVGVIDTGAAVDHPVLTGQNLTYRDFVLREPGAPIPEHHGTALAAIIAADGRDGAGLIGVAPTAEVFVLRACWEAPIGGAGRCNSFSLARALNFSIMNEMDVINLSLGGPGDPILEDLVRAALDKGIAIVAAAGDAGTFPSQIPGVIVTDPSGKAGIAAPGIDVLSAKPADGYDFFSGASVSAAHVSGTIALMKSMVPEAPPSAIARSLQEASVSGLDACAALSRLRDQSVDCGRD